MSHQTIPINPLFAVTPENAGNPPVHELNKRGEFINWLRSQNIVFFSGAISVTSNNSKKLNIPEWSGINLENCAKYYNCQHPAVFIRTGEVSGVWVLDWDFKDQATIDLYNRVVTTYGVPKTLIVRTGNNGFHWYFKIDAGNKVTQKLKSLTNLTVDGKSFSVDTRANGGIIIAPYSFYQTQQTTKLYFALTEWDLLTTAPDWLFQVFDVLKYQNNKELYLSSITEVGKRPDETSKAPATLNFDLVIKLMDCLSRKRCDDFAGWRNVGLCLKGLASSFASHAENLFDLFKEWSQLSLKYQDNCCEILVWNEDNKRKKFKIASLIYWAQMDDPKQFAEFSNQLRNITPQAPKSAFDINTKISLKFSPEETVNCERLQVEQYALWTSNKNLICIQSNMATAKTQALIPLLPKFHRVMFVYFRVSLNKEMHSKLASQDFVLYTDVEHKTDYLINSGKYPKLIIQVDSLHRVRGAFDLLVLDEIESTLSHLLTFTKNFKECWKSLKTYCMNTKQVVCCDATLQDGSLKALFGPRIKNEAIKITNLFARNSDYTAHIIRNKSELFVRLHTELITNNKNIVFPTNSNAFAKVVYTFFTHNFKDLKILLINKDTKEHLVDKWDQFNLLIYTPSICAGISFERVHFHQCFGYFCNTSCDAELSAQMLTRVRNLTDKKMVLCLPPDSQAHLSVTPEHLDRMIDRQLFEDTKTNLEWGLPVASLDIDAYHQTAKHNSFYKALRHVLKKQLLSRTYFASYLIHILRMHGVQIVNCLQNTTDVIKLQTTTKTLTKVSAVVKDVLIKEIIAAPPMDDQTFLSFTDQMKLSSSTPMTQEQLRSLERRKLTNAFGLNHDTELTYDFTAKHYKLCNGYLQYHDCLCNSTGPKTHFENIKCHLKMLHSIVLFTAFSEVDLWDNIQQAHIVEQKIKQIFEYEFVANKYCDDDCNNVSSDEETEDNKQKKICSKKVSKTVFSSIKWDKKNLQLYFMMDLLQAAGFSSLQDTAKVQMNWVRLLQFLKDHEHAFKSLFKVRGTMNWQVPADNAAVSANDKKSVLHYIQPKLQTTLAINIQTVSKHENSPYHLVQLFDQQEIDKLKPKGPNKVVSLIRDKRDV
jgi:hypothetical protein